jgi:hypothetical protein
MATLQAIVDIQDRATAKFARMTTAAKSFEMQLDKVSRKLTEVEAKMIALSRMKVSMRVSLDTSGFDAQLAALVAKTKAASMMDVNAGADGFASPRIADDLGLDEVVAKVVDRNKIRRVNIAQANNGVLGFLIVATRAVRNFRAIAEPIGNLFQSAIGKGLTFAEPLAAAFGRTLNGMAIAAKPMVGLLSSVAGGIVALTGAAFIAVQIGTALAGVLGLIATALTSLLVPLAAVIPALGAIVGVIGFVAIPLMKWVSDTKKLVDEKDKLNKKIETLDKSSKEYARTQTRLNEIQKELNKSGAEGVFRQLQNAGERVSGAVFTPQNNQLFTNIIGSGLEALRPLLPILTKLVTVFATEVSKVAEKFANFTKDPRNLLLILLFFESAAKLIQPMADGVGKLGKMFMLLSLAVTPIAERLLRDFVGWLDQINEKISSPEGIANIGSFFDKIYPAFMDLMGLIGAFIGGVRDVGVALAPEFSMVIGWLREFGGQFVKWIIETVQKYGPDFGRFMKIIGNAIGIVWDLVTKAYDAFKPLIDIVLLALEIVINVLRAFLRFAEVVPIIDVIAIAAGILLSPFKLVLTVVKDLSGWINDMFTMLADSAVGKAISGVFGMIRDAVMNVSGWIDKIVSGIKWLMEKASWLFGGGEPGNTAQTRLELIDSQRQDLVDQGSRPDPSDPFGQRLIPPSGNVFGGASGASGAVVTKPTRALIGEAGPEMVVPLHAASGARRLQYGGNGGVQISGDVHVHGVQNLDQFVTEVQKYISNLPRESGSEMSVG